MARLRTISMQRPPQGLSFPGESGATASRSADLRGVTQAWPAKVVHFWSGADTCCQSETTKEEATHPDDQWVEEPGHLIGQSGHAEAIGHGFP